MTELRSSDKCTTCGKARDVEPNFCSNPWHMELRTSKESNTNKDWLYWYENPSEAASKIERQEAEIERLRNLLCEICATHTYCRACKGILASKGVSNAHETISLPATLRAEGLPDFAEVMRLPPEVLRERYWTQSEWIRGYAHCLDGLLGAGSDYSGLLPQDIRRAFEARAELKARASPNDAVRWICGECSTVNSNDDLHCCIKSCKGCRPFGWPPAQNGRPSP